MAEAARDGRFANSAIVVQVRPGDYADYGALQIDHQGALVDVTQVAAIAVDDAGVAYLTVNADAYDAWYRMFIETTDKQLDVLHAHTDRVLGIVHEEAGE